MSNRTKLTITAVLWVMAAAIPAVADEDDAKIRKSVVKITASIRG